MTLDELKSWLNEFRTNWKRAALFLIGIIVLILLIAYATSFVGEKAKIHATPEETNSTNNGKNLPKNEKESESGKKLKTLYDYFKTDFPNYYAVSRNIGLRVFTDVPERKVTKDYELEFRLHCDFDSLTKFISVYLPYSTFPNQISICKVVAQQSQDISIIISKGIIVAASRYDDRKTEINSLKFTGRVYIYHDAYLSDDDKDELRHFYKQKRLDPRFRGANYIEKRLLYNNSSSDK